MPAGYDPSKRPWFNDAMNKKENIVRTAPYAYKNLMLTSNVRTVTDKSGKIIGNHFIHEYLAQVLLYIKNHGC